MLVRLLLPCIALVSAADEVNVNLGFGGAGHKELNPDSGCTHYIGERTSGDDPCVKKPTGDCNRWGYEDHGTLYACRNPSFLGGPCSRTDFGGKQKRCPKNSEADRQRLDQKKEEEDSRRKQMEEEEELRRKERAYRAHREEMERRQRREEEELQKKVMVMGSLLVATIVVVFIYWHQIIAIGSALCKACVVAAVAYGIVLAYNMIENEDDDATPQIAALTVASIYLASKLLIWYRTDPSTLKAKEKALPFTSGDSVLVKGLERKPHLNGKVATVRSYNMSSERYNVSVDGDTLALKAINLVAVTI